MDRLAIKLEEHSHSMIRDVAQLMLDVKQRLALAKMVAVDGERHVAEQRLAVKQVGVGVCALLQPAAAMYATVVER